MQAHGIRFGKQGLQHHRLHAQLFPIRCVHRQKRIIGHDPHPTGTGAQRHVPGDPSESDKTEHLAGYLAAHHTFPGPCPGGDSECSAIAASGEHEQPGEHIFGHRRVVRACGRNNRDAPFPAGLAVNIVKAHAKAAHYAQMCAFQQRATHLRPIADDERAAPSCGGGQFLGPVHEGFVIKNIKRRPQIGDGGLIHEL